MFGPPQAAETNANAMKKNRYGLSRYIPEDIALEVRRRSKFGCVVCRCAVYQYEHIDPSFAHATKHDPEKICLLCGGCHDKVTRRRLSKESVQAKYLQVMQSNEIRRPFEELDLATQNISVSMSTAKFEHTQNLIQINGRKFLSITPPTEGSSFPTLSGIFCDHNGQETLRITNNVWEGAINAWDIQVVSTQVSIRTANGRTALEFLIEPPDKIKIKELNMYFENCHLICNKDGLLVGRARGKRRTYIGVGNFECGHAKIGVDIDSSFKNIMPRGLKITGGEGVSLEGTGIRIAVGAGMMYVNDINVWTHQE